MLAAPLNVNAQLHFIRGVTDAAETILPSAVILQMGCGGGLEDETLVAREKK